jgi:hypothetical protein
MVNNNSVQAAQAAFHGFHVLGGDKSRMKMKAKKPYIDSSGTITGIVDPHSKYSKCKKHRTARAS